MATKMRSSKLSYFKCMKLESTIKDLAQAINNATPNVNEPSCKLATEIVENVKNNKINNVFDKDLYSMVCVVLFAMINVFHLLIIKTPQAPPIEVK